MLKLKPNQKFNIDNNTHVEWMRYLSLMSYMNGDVKDIWEGNDDELGDLPRLKRDFNLENDDEVLAWLTEYEGYYDNAAHLVWKPEGYIPTKSEIEDMNKAQ